MLKFKHGGLLSAAAFAALCVSVATPASAGTVIPDATINAHVVSCGATCGGSSLAVTTGSESGGTWTDGPETIGSSMGYLLTQLPPPSNTVGSTGLTNNVATFSAGGSSTTFTATTSPSITTTQSTSPYVGTDAFGQLNYWFEVVGSGGTASITVNAIGQTTENTGTPGQATAELYIPGLISTLQDNIQGNSTFTENGTYTVDVNTLYEVELITNLECGGLSVSCSASIDPTITLNTLGATLDFSPNLASTTPLPATLPLFASGLGALGLLGWRRKRKVQAAA